MSDYQTVDTLRAKLSAAERVRDHYSKRVAILEARLSIAERFAEMLRNGTPDHTEAVSQLMDEFIAAFPLPPWEKKL